MTVNVLNSSVKLTTQVIHKINGTDFNLLEDQFVPKKFCPNSTLLYQAV